MGFVYVIVTISTVIFRSKADNLGTLRTYQAASCDDNYVTLRCPKGTVIAIQVAQYGKSAPPRDLCRNSSGGQLQLMKGKLETSNSQDITVSAFAKLVGTATATTVTPITTTPTSSSQTNSNQSCIWTSALQHSLLQTVVETCQKREKCRFQLSSTIFGEDPCPGIRKYVEVAYKCRPYEFLSKIACENENILLNCTAHSRVAIYSAKYGRTEYESVKCPQPQGVPEETCLVSYATEAVMQLCHGKRSCKLSADVSTFGKPCHDLSKTYLKVVYTCVPRKILKQQFETSTEQDEFNSHYYYPTRSIYNIIKNNGSREFSVVVINSKKPKTDPTIDQNRAVPHFTTRSFPFHLSHQDDSDSHQSHATKGMQADEIQDPNCTVTIITNEKSQVIGFISDWINAYTFVSQNQERFYLYLILSIAVATVLGLILVVGRLLMQRHRTQCETKFNATNNSNGSSLPNGFTDDISEIDADIDFTSSLPIPIHSVNVHSHSHSSPLVLGAEQVRNPVSHPHHISTDYTLHRSHMETANRPILVDPIIREPLHSLESVPYSQGNYYG